MKAKFIKKTHGSATRGGSGESINDEVKRIEEQRENFNEGDNLDDIDDLSLDD